MSNVKKAVLTAICIALCYVLPLLFHGVQNAGRVFLPMHLPVFLCGLLCGWPYGLLCGLAGSALSHLLTGMPPVVVLPSMLLELAVYGLVSGFMMKKIHTKCVYADIYISLLCAIVTGRVLAGIAQALLFSAGTYSMDKWIASYALVSWPGTLIQLIVVPAVIIAAMRANLIPPRYHRGA